MASKKGEKKMTKSRTCLICGSGSAALSSGPCSP
jgi:hypothetical protein